jgi:hypothetical protein
MKVLRNNGVVPRASRWLSLLTLGDKRFHWAPKYGDISPDECYVGTARAQTWL